MLGLRRSFKLTALSGSRWRQQMWRNMGARAGAENALKDEEEVRKPVVKVETLYPRGSFELASNPEVSLPDGTVRIKYASVGDPNKPTILVCPSMSNSVHIVDGEEVDENGKVKKFSGWWRGVVGHGPEFGIDLDRFHVIVGAPMGSPFGSTSPLTPRSKDSSEPFRNTFPQITPLDQAAHQKLLLDELGIQKVYAVVGGSMGGMQVLQFAANFPEMYDIFCSIASTAHTSPGTVALRSVQRAAVRMDPDFKNGDYESNPTRGMAVARQFGTICYRSPKEFDARFDWYPTVMEHTKEVSFEVERYLQHQALKFTKNVNYDANCWLLLSQSMDLMDIGQGVGSFDSGASRIPTDKHGLLLSYSTDRLTPPQDQERLATVLGRNNVPVHFEIIPSTFGHDAFLIENQAQPINVRLRSFLEAEKGQHVDSVRRLIKEMYEH